MSQQDDASNIYAHLTKDFLPQFPGKTITYGQINKDTGVEIGVEGGYMGAVLGLIATGCAYKKLPSLTSIIVGQGNMPGKGYFTQLAILEQDGNPGGWRIDHGISRWIQKPIPAGFDKDLYRWQYRQMIDEHQNDVWAQSVWPESL